MTRYFKAYTPESAGQAANTAFVPESELTGGTSLSKATGAEVNTGTEDTKYVTAKAIADSNVVVSDRVADDGTNVSLAAVEAGEHVFIGDITVHKPLVQVGADGLAIYGGDAGAVVNIQTFSTASIYGGNSQAEIELDDVAQTISLLAPNGVLIKPPTSDPGIEGVLWNNAGTLAISEG